MITDDEVHRPQILSISWSPSKPTLTQANVMSKVIIIIETVGKNDTFSGYLTLLRWWTNYIVLEQTNPRSLSKSNLIMPCPVRASVLTRLKNEINLRKEESVVILPMEQIVTAYSSDRLT